MGKKKILDSLKGAIGIKESMEATEQTITELCWDAINCKCIAFENKDGKLVRLYPPTLTGKQIEEATKGGSIKIIPFK